jgi:hypothetical protein
MEWVPQDRAEKRIRGLARTRRGRATGHGGVGSVGSVQADATHRTRARAGVRTPRRPVVLAMPCSGTLHPPRLGQECQARAEKRIRGLARTRSDGARGRGQRRRSASGRIRRPGRAQGGRCVPRTPDTRSLGVRLYSVLWHGTLGDYLYRVSAVTRTRGRFAFLRRAIIILNCSSSSFVAG